MNQMEKLAHGIVDALRKAWTFLNQDVPEWLTDLCTTIGEILFSLLKMAGQSYIKQIENAILETAKEYPNKTGEEKFNIVWDFAFSILPKSWKESEIDTLIQNLYIRLKKNNNV